MLRLAVVLLILATLAGCGYRPEGYVRTTDTLAPRLYLELARNRTGRAFIENPLTNRLVERFGRGGHFRVSEARSEAELILAVDISNYNATAVAYDRTDRIQLYRAHLTVVGTLTRNSDGRILWKGTVSESTEYAADIDRAVQQANENLAIDQLTVLLADDLYARSSDDF